MINNNANIKIHKHKNLINLLTCELGSLFIALIIDCVILFDCFDKKSTPIIFICILVALFALLLIVRFFVLNTRTLQSKKNTFLGTLLTLVKMQLKEKLNLKNISLKELGIFKITLTILLYVLKYASIIVLCAAVLFAANYLNIFAQGVVPQSVISLVFLFMLITSIVSCTAGLTKSLYYSRDNAILLTLPCSPTQIYLSKLIVFFIFELKRNSSFIIPLFIAYYITHNYPIVFYPWMLIAFVLISLFTVSLGALLSIPTMWFSNFFRQKKLLQMISLVVIIVFLFVALVFAISLIPENIDLVGTWEKTSRDIRNFLVSYTLNFGYIFDLTNLMLGDPYFYTQVFKILPMLSRFGQILGFTIALFAIGMLIVRPLFYKMASKPFEYLKKLTKPKKNKKINSLLSPLHIETLSLIKSIDRVFTNVGILLSIPLLTYLLNKIFLAMNTRETGQHMIVAFNILIIMLVALNSNCSIASIYSRDGRSSYLIKTQPVKHYVLLASRLIPEALVVIISMIATMVVLLTTTAISPIDVVTLVISLIMFYLAHMFFSAEQDIMNPQYQIYATMGENENNPNESKSTVTAFIISFLLAGSTFLLLDEGRGFVYIKLLLVGLGALAYCSWSFFNNIKLFYKEK